MGISLSWAIVSLDQYNYQFLEKRSMCFLVNFMAIIYRLIWIVFLFLSLEDIFVVDSPLVEEGWFAKMPSLQLLHLTKHRHNILASRRYHWFHYFSVLWICFTTELISLFWFLCSLLVLMYGICPFSSMEDRRFICLEFVS